MITVDIYCRVSTDRQEGNTSLDEQEQVGRKYCEENELLISMVHREVYSGALYRERKKLSLMRERYLAGKIQGIVFSAYDRLARKEVHQVILLDEMQHNKVEIHCVKEQLDDTVTGRLTCIFLGFLAEWEWEKIRERTTMGRINAAKEGKIVGGRKLPYGWRWVLSEKGEKEKIIHHEKHLWIIRWMTIKYARGTSTLEIAKTLTDRGIPTSEGEPGSQWHPIMVRRILTNERLTGKGQNFFYKGSDVKEHLEAIDLPEGTYPAIISQELFDKIQVRLERNKDEVTRKSERPEEFLLRAGYIRCGYCGRKMYTRIDRSKRVKRTVVHKDGWNYRYVYRCKKHDPIGNVICVGQELSSKEIDAWVVEQIKILAEHTELIGQAIELAANVRAFQVDDKAIEASLIIWEQKATNYLEDLEDPGLRGDSRASIRNALDLANQNVEQLKLERAQILLGMIDREREKAAYQDILLWCKKVKEAKEELTYQQKRDFLHMMGIVVVVTRDNGKLNCSMEIALPEIKELIGQNHGFEERFPMISFGKGRVN